MYTISYERGIPINRERVLHNEKIIRQRNQTIIKQSLKT